MNPRSKFSLFACVSATGTSLLLCLRNSRQKNLQRIMMLIKVVHKTHWMLVCTLVTQSLFMWWRLVTPFWHDKKMYNWQKFNLNTCILSITHHRSIINLHRNVELFAQIIISTYACICIKEMYPKVDLKMPVWSLLIFNYMSK